MAPIHRNFSSLGFHSRSHRLYKKQMRINSVLLSMRRVSVAPTSDLLHWRQRVEHARALCSSAVARMTGEEETEAKICKRPRVDWGRPRKSSRKKKAKDKDRTKSVDDIRVWNEENQDETKTSPSDNENFNEKITKTVIGLSRNSSSHNEKPKYRTSLSSKGRLYQEWRGKSRFKNIITQECTATSGLTIEPIKHMQVAEDKFPNNKNKVSPGRSPRSLSPSVNIRGVGSPRASRSSVATKPRLSKCKASHVDRSPSPAFRSLSPRISPLTPGYFDLSNTSTSLEPKHYLSPFTALDVNNNWPVVHNHKYTFKSTSMINLPALLKTK